MAFLAQGATNICKIFVTDYQVINELTGHEFWSWGSHVLVDRGMLGDNTTVAKSSPVQTVSGGTNWRIAAGTAGIKTDGTLWLWGDATNGNLGDNTLVARSSPVQTVSGGSNWRHIARRVPSLGSDATSVALKTDGTLWAWGSNSSGELGDNTTVPKSSPIQTVAGGTNWRCADVGGATTASNVIGGIKTDGTLWMWGANASGQLGDNTTVPKSSPVQVTGSATTWKQLSIGFNFMSAIKTDGTLWTWGDAAFGRLGITLNVDRSSPVQTVAGGSNWKCTISNGAHTAAIKTDGTLWTWGCNVNGNLGDNTTVNKSSPVQTISGGNNWRLAIMGFCSAAAIKTDGTLWTWGFGTCGSLGNNTTTSVSSPVQVAGGGTNWRSLGRLNGGHTISALRLFSGYDF